MNAAGNAPRRDALIKMSESPILIFPPTPLGILTYTVTTHVSAVITAVITSLSVLDFIALFIKILLELIGQGVEKIAKKISAYAETLRYKRSLMHIITKRNTSHFGNHILRSLVYAENACMPPVSIATQNTSCAVYGSLPSRLY